MNPFKIRQIEIKKIDLLISKNLGEKDRLEQIQMKLARGWPLFSENRAYIDALILENLSDEEVQTIQNQVKSAELEESEYDEQKTFHCICCGNVKNSLGHGGMCGNCYLDYNIKISKFITRPTGGSTF